MTPFELAHRDNLTLAHTLSTTDTQRWLGNLDLADHADNDGRHPNDYSWTEALPEWCDICEEEGITQADCIHRPTCVDEQVDEFEAGAYDCPHGNPLGSCAGCDADYARIFDDERDNLR